MPGLHGEPDRSRAGRSPLAHVGIHALVTLVGECNRCGLCCTFGGYTCINLQIDTVLGQPQATRCMAYDVRFEGMDIVGRNTQGEMRWGKCRKDTPAETAIIVQFIGKGCSLKRKE